MHVNLHVLWPKLRKRLAESPAVCRSVDADDIHAVLAAAPVARRLREIARTPEGKTRRKGTVSERSARRHDHSVR